MFHLSVPWWEFVIRGVIVFAFLLIMLRLTGKRQVGQLSPFDLILLLILSNAVQNSMNAGDSSLLGGLISASTLIAMNWAMGYWSFRDQRVERLMEGTPVTLIENGKIKEDVLKNEYITRRELEAALRHSGAFSIDEVKRAVLEITGQVSVDCRKK